jgi:hypothetical protein
MKYESNYKVQLQTKGDEKTVSHNRDGNWRNNVWASATGKHVESERPGSDNLDFGNDVKLSIVLVLILFLTPRAVMAQAWQLEPSATVQQSYNDNFRLTTASEDKVFTTRLAGGLGLKRLTETIEIEGLVRADFVKYSGDTKNLNDLNNQLLGFKATRKFERTKLGLDFLFRRDGLLRTVTVIEDPRNVGIDPDESVDNSVVTENVRRLRTVVRPKFDYQLTERSNMGLRYLFNNTNYNDNENTGLTDFKNQSITGTFQTQVTEKNTILALVSGSRFDSDSGNTTDNIELQVGVSYDFDETTNVGFTLGGRHTKFDTSTANTSNDGFVARLRASKLGGLTKFSFRLERRLSPSGIGDEVETNELNFNLTRRLSPLLLFSLRSRGFENDWYFETTYQYTRQKRYNTPDSADSNSVFVSINYRLPTPLD